MFPTAYWRSTCRDHCENMRRKKKINLNDDPSSKTRVCTNDSENITGSQETRVGTVGNREGM